MPIPRQLLQYFLSCVPPYMIVLGALVFGSSHVWLYYNDALITAATTQLKTAKASVEEAKASAAAAPAGNESMRVQTMRADVAKKQHDAELAKIEADAQNSLVKDEIAALTKARADLFKRQQEAANAKQAADAASAKFGVRTLAERAEFVKFVGAELDNMVSRHNVAAAQANIDNSALLPGYAERVYPSIIEAECRGNALAKYLGCPKRYWQS